VSAINAMHGTGAAAPAYRDFVQVHVHAMSMGGMAWAVHTMPEMHMVGRNFLAWHRQFLRRLELRLQEVDPSVTIPYWDWIADPALPPALSKRSLLHRWSVTRHWDASLLPTAGEVTHVMERTTFRTFQHRLEQIHNAVHIAVGGDTGTMSGPSSPADPVFFLHHANIDRLWARWQAGPQGARPSNRSEVLQPPPLFGVSVSSVLRISALGYSYAA
jgi:tyrosinase